MYFPYVRGRQYELLALRELVANNLLSKHIIPIIEPVKLSSSLAKTMEEFIKNDRRLGIVCNPTVGSFINEMNNEEKNTARIKFLEYLRNESIIKTHIINEKSLAMLTKQSISLPSSNLNNIIIICNNRDYINSYLDLFSNHPPKCVLIPDDFRRKIKDNKVLFEDKFDKCERNSDYQKNEDCFFSDNHLFYSEEGYIGFGDYSIIGKDYLESGFAPFAVAMHIVYFADDNSLRVHHFVSDSNDDIKNPAKKFYESVSKMAKWTYENHIPNTAGLSLLLEHYKNQTYPGLGSVKKLSLMHHLELIGKYLDKGN